MSEIGGSEIAGAAVGVGEIGFGVATMNPMAIFAGVTSLIGVGTSIAGGAKATQAAKQVSQISQANAQLEIQANAQRRRAMEISARRQQLEIVRNQQRARAMALNAATNQGAQFGTGLQGGYGQISGQTGVNQLGITQNLEIGRNLYDLNDQMSQNKIRLAGVQSSAATAQGLASLGGSLVSSSQSIGRLGSLGFGKEPRGQMFMGDGSQSSMGGGFGGGVFGASN